jgi:hypothetical protein
VWQEGLGKLIKFSYLIGSQTYDLPASSIVPKPANKVMYSQFRNIVQGSVESESTM